jgi:hypothetical protein
LRSNYFKKILKDDKNFSDIILNEISESVLLNILDFIYTGSINSNIEFEDMISLLTWADEFELKELKYLCENSLIYGIDTSNVIDILIAGYRHNLMFLKSTAINYIILNFQEISEKKSFYKRRHILNC